MTIRHFRMKITWIAMFLFWTNVHCLKAEESCGCGDLFTQCPETPDPVLEGTPLDLECSATDTEFCMWIKTNSSSSGFRVTNPDKSCDWKIHNATYDDNGAYNCLSFQAGQSNPICSSPVHIQVATYLQNENLHLIRHPKHSDGYKDHSLRDHINNLKSFNQGGKGSQESKGGNGSNGSQESKGGNGSNGSKGGSSVAEVQVERNDFNNSDIACIIENASLTPTAKFSIDEYILQQVRMEKLKFYGAKKDRADLTYVAVLQREWEDHDNGKTLKCTVEYHQAPKLNQKAETSVYLNITYAPFLPKNYYHVKTGMTEDKVIEVKSNPPLRLDEVTVLHPGIQNQLLQYDIVVNQDDTCDVEITVNANDIVHETYWNITIEARDEQLPVYIHIAGNPDKTKTKGGSKGGTKGGGNGGKNEAQTDPDEDNNKKEGGNEEDDNNSVIIICAILICLLIIAGVTAYLAIKKKRSQKDITVEEAALYKNKNKGKKDFKDLSVIPEESQQDSMRKSQLGEYQMMQEEGAPSGERKVIAKPSPVPRSRVGAGEYQEMQEEGGQYEEREVVAEQTPEQKSRDDEPAVLEVNIESK